MLAQFYLKFLKAVFVTNDLNKLLRMARELGIDKVYQLNLIATNGLLPDATIYIDGKKYNNTPLIIPSILIGEHKVEILKNGYKTEIENVNIKEGETKDD